MVSATLRPEQFSRRLRQLDGTLERLRRSWVVELGGVDETHLLIDIAVVIVVRTGCRGSTPG
ncbi:hypothetical protein [Leptothermofonsia sp. ETS-13]|uniref:hypothetical protein n=1 Tax=Leptothermofonsia sp. ETS-13 TaxID=3035696 RepID=UPI003BA38F42